MSPDAETVQSALEFIPAYGRELWLRMGMAVKSELGEDGFWIWDGWSRSAENYSDRDAKEVWRSIKPTGKVTVGTLIYGLFGALAPLSNYIKNDIKNRKEKRRVKKIEAAEFSRLILDTASVWPTSSERR